MSINEKHDLYDEDEYCNHRKCNYIADKLILEKWFQIGLPAIGSLIVILIAFYFKTTYTVSANEAKINKQTILIDSKADKQDIDKRLDRIEKKVDDIIEYQLNNR